MFSISALETICPSTASPVAGTRWSVTALTTNGTLEGLLARKSTITMEAPLLGSARMRTLRILPSSRRCAPCVAVRIVKTRAPTTASPATRKIQKPLLMLIAQQAAVGLEGIDVIAQCLQGGGQ